MKKIPNVRSSRIIHDGFFSLREDILERADGYKGSFTSVICGDAVAIIAQTREGLWVLNREYRHATGEILLGCPGGRLEPGEDPLTGGKREFFEETGYSSDEIILLGSCYPFPGICNQKIHYLFAKNAERKSDQQLDPFEFIETALLTQEALQKHIHDGAPVDGVLLTALLYKSLP
ncbi:MAG: NUDIX hydrolase [Chlamydiia bacterium]|nr:NUDIX hydrolase [Chlamydiia bacterium]